MTENIALPEPENESGPNPSTVLQIGRDIVQERFFFFLILAGLMVLTFFLIRPYILAILTAIALVVIIKPLYNRVLDKKWVGGNPFRATAVTLTIFLLLIATPIIIFVWIAYNQANALVSESLSVQTLSMSMLTDGFETFVEAFAEQGQAAISQENLLSTVQDSLSSFSTWVANGFVGIAGWLAQFFTSAVITLVIMMVLLPRFETPEQDQMASIIPFPPDITNLYLDKIKMMIMAMFKGTFLIAVIQGAAMGVVFIIAGVPYVFVLTILSMFLALLPMIGISLIAWPIAVILVLNGQIWQGIFVITAFLIIVSNIDTALRPVLVPKAAYLNPALVMLSVFGGLSLMGFIGLIYGPVIMILLVTSIEVYAKYIMRSDLEPFLAEDGSLDMEKLGLRKSGEEEPSNVRTVMRRVANIVSRGVAKVGDKNVNSEAEASL